MQILGVIPSRWGSTRFPGKSLHPILGRPLILWVIEAVQRTTRLDRIIVATDDDRIATVARASGVEVALTSPNHPTGTDRVAEAAKAADDDVVINIQGDEPLIEPALIDQLAAKLATDTRWQMATAACPIASLEELHSPNTVKLVLDSDDAALYFSRLPLPYRRDGPPDLASGLHWRHLGLYGYRGKLLNQLVKTPPCRLEEYEMLEQLRALHLGARIAVLKTTPMGIGVDTPQDVVYLETELRRRQLS